MEQSRLLIEQRIFLSFPKESTLPQKNWRMYMSSHNGQLKFGFMVTLFKITLSLSLSQRLLHAKLMLMKKELNTMKKRKAVLLLFSKIKD